MLRGEAEGLVAPVADGPRVAQGPQDEQVIHPPRAEEVRQATHIGCEAGSRDGWARVVVWISWG